MTSEQRREARYQRRKQKREAKRLEFASKYSDYNNVISPEALMQSADKCKQGVRWKCSVEKFITHELSYIRILNEELLNRTWNSPGFTAFDIIERGHPRHILSVCIQERVIQRSLCDNYLTPILMRPLIYDNAATLPGKGLSFSLRRFNAHLERYIRKYGNEGWILFFDFSSYFALINNILLLIKANRYLPNEDLNILYSKFILAFGELGLGLGSQVSQISAVFYPNDIDHYIKDVLGILYYGRYMDDGYAIFRTKEEAMEFGILLQKLCEENSILINPKKCKCVKITSNFIFLKQRYYVDGERIIKRVSRSVARKERQRLRKYKDLVDQGLLSYKDVCFNFTSWLGIYYNRNDFFMLLNLIKYFNSLFKDDYGYFNITKPKNRKEKVFKYMAKRAIYNHNIETRRRSNCKVMHS